MSCFLKFLKLFPGGARLILRQRENGEENCDGGRRAREPRHEPLNAAAEKQHHRGIEQEQQKRGEQDRPAQILRLADAIDFMARISERREIERRQAIGGSQRVHRDERHPADFDSCEQDRPNGV